MYLVYLLYLISGRIKVLLNFLGISVPVDITLILTIILSLGILFSLIRRLSFQLKQDVLIPIILLSIFNIFLFLSCIYSPSELIHGRKHHYFC